MSELLASGFLVLFAASIAVAAARVRLAGWSRVAAGVAASWGLASAVLIGAALANREPPRPLAPEDVPLEVADDEYRSSGVCRSCHPEQYETWHASYHRTMTQRVTQSSVIGDFDDVRIEFGGDRYALFQDNGKFFGRIDARDPLDPSGPTHRAVVELVQSTGSHHMQIYWYSARRGRSLSGFPIVYLREQQRWVPRKAAFLTPPGPALQDLGNWNGVCIECHTTHPRPRIRDPRRRRSDSHVTELGIACEACHGPGGDHADANRSPLRRYGLHLSSTPDPTIVDPRDLSHVRSSQVCGQCHVVKTTFSQQHFDEWMEKGSSFRPGEDLDQHVQILSPAHVSAPGVRELLEDTPDFLRSTFWEGGSVRVSGREYNGLLESPCFQRGEMSCTSCHRLHQPRSDPRERAEWADDQLALGMRTNEACLQCHEGFAGDEDLAAHTRHPADSTGSECMNCHMPHTTYGLLKAIRSHQIDSPSVAVELDEGRPNACNLCHLDRSLGWTAERLASWHGTEPPPLSQDEAEIAAGVRWVLEGDAGLRAIAAWSMGWAPAQEAAGTSWLFPYLAELMNDPYDAVRMIATRSLRSLPGLEDAAFEELAAAEERAAAIGAIAVRWESSPAGPSGRGRGARTLFDEYGQLRLDEIARLRERRDDRPLTLAE
jgi:hypothetical protein